MANSLQNIGDCNGSIDQYQVSFPQLGPAEPDGGTFPPDFGRLGNPTQTKGAENTPQHY